ncbi:MAG: hypothetical protein DRP70_16730 [Spirochaetes bacterium]|nr:MAG: hypothetical protein DRP70_16730 [Spirochaetota bacterium]
MATATGAEATRVDLTLQPGATLILTISDLDGVDITGATAKMQIRSLARFPVELLALTEASGIALGGVAGTIVATVTAAQTAAIVENSRYDFLLTYQDGTVDKLRTGTLTRRRPVTV